VPICCILKRVDILNPPFPKKNVFAVHVDCLLKMKNILYCFQSTNNADGSIMIYLMLTHILVMTQLEKLLIQQILQMQEEHVVI
jgi:hypothetical protein